MRAIEQLRWVFDAVMRARGWTAQEAERLWSEVESCDADMIAWYDSFYRAEWASIQSGWRPRIPSEREEVQRWLEADRLI